MVLKNHMTAQEQFPEFFGSITMIYVDVKVNDVAVQAFVDSGAQATIISQECAKRCNLMHLLDTRFAGMAQGVGTSRILGRVHLADLMIGGQKLPCSFTVLEDNKVDLLFGLDNLKRHQCSIDLVTSNLHIRNGEVSVPFLGDGQIKKSFGNSPAEVDESKFDQSMIKELMELTGQPKEGVVQALQMCEGNKEQAANLLMSEK